MFAGKITLREPGDHTVDVYAYDPANGNTGLIKAPVTARSVIQRPNSCNSGMVAGLGVGGFERK